MNFGTGFRTELTELSNDHVRLKTASTAASRYMAADPTGERARRVGAQIVEHMRTGKLRSREFSIRRLGEGASQRADLVVSPQFGVAVRKVFKQPHQQESAGNRLVREHLGTQRYDHIAAALGDRSLPGDPAAVRYWEPAFGAPAKIGRRTLEEHRALTRRLNERLSVFGKGSTGGWIRSFPPEQQARISTARLDRAEPAATKAQRLLQQGAAGPGVLSDVRAINQRLSGAARDYAAPRNIVGGKLVDFDFHRDDTPIAAPLHQVSSPQQDAEALRARLRSVNDPTTATRIFAPGTAATEPPRSTAPARSSSVPWSGLAAGAGAAALGYGAYRWWKSRKAQERQKRTKAGLPR